MFSSFYSKKFSASSLAVSWRERDPTVGSDSGWSKISRKAAKKKKKKKKKKKIFFHKQLGGAVEAKKTGFFFAVAPGWWCWVSLFFVLIFERSSEVP